jgi:hypothetical protein
MVVRKQKSCAKSRPLGSLSFLLGLLPLPRGPRPKSEIPADSKAPKTRSSRYHQERRAKDGLVASDRSLRAPRRPTRQDIYGVIGSERRQQLEKGVRGELCCCCCWGEKGQPNPAPWPFPKPQTTFQARAQRVSIENPSPIPNQVPPRGESMSDPGRSRRQREAKVNFHPLVVALGRPPESRTARGRAEPRRPVQRVAS